MFCYVDLINKLIFILLLINHFDLILPSLLKQMLISVEVDVFSEYWHCPSINF
jgi:hypothetical protein